MSLPALPDSLLSTVQAEPDVEILKETLQGRAVTGISLTNQGLSGVSSGGFNHWGQSGFSWVAAAVNAIITSVRNRKVTGISLWWGLDLWGLSLENTVTHPTLYTCFMKGLRRSAITNSYSRSYFACWEYSTDATTNLGFPSRWKCDERIYRHNWKKHTMSLLPPAVSL